MIVLDTNVLSEPLQAHPDDAVLDWLDRQAVETLFTTSFNLAELRVDIEGLPHGRRRESLTRGFESVILPLFEGRVLDFGAREAESWSRLRVDLMAAGRPMPLMDSLIAATCLSHDMILATRNTEDFTDTGLTLINPWEA